MVKKYHFLLIVFAAILWSADGVFRRNLYSLPPTVVVLFEHLIGFLLLAPFLIPKRTELKKLTKKDLLSFLWIALLSGVLGTVLYTAALGQVQYIKYSVVVLLQQTQPFVVIAFAALILKEKITKQYLLWALLGIVGAYLISFPDLTINLTHNTGQIIAALLALGAAFCWGSSTAFSRRNLQKFAPHITTGIRFGLTIPLALGFVFLTNTQAQLSQVTTPQWLSLLAIALTTGMVGLIIYYHGLKFTQAKVSAISELAWPLSAMVIGYFSFGERLTIVQIIGAAFLLFSMYRVGVTQKNAVT